MKVKLLKKIRRRFKYWRNSKGKFFLMDHKHKKITKIDMQFAKDNQYYRGKKYLKVSKEEFLFRILKSKMLNPFGYYFNDTLYNKFKRRKNLTL